MTTIALVGEAWGVEEARECMPFCGYPGHELTRMLTDAGIRRTDCFLTNVFNQHPPGNDLSFFCGPKAEALSGYPSLGQSRHVRAQFAYELERLRDELVEVNPNCIVALGNTPMWALLGRTAITKFRGTTDLSTHTATGFKVLPTYHPAAVCRQWELRPTTVLDLAKALRESAFPEIRRPKVRVFIPETVEDLYEFEREFIATSEILSVDIETAGPYITCIGFAPNVGYSLVIPFTNYQRKSRAYWPSVQDELAAWRFVRAILGKSKPRKLFQNGLFDIAVLWRGYGIKVMGAEHDSMLLHHSLQPESLKGLGFLGSIYTDHGSWKHMRNKNESFKRED